VPSGSVNGPSYYPGWKAAFAATLNAAYSPNIQTQNTIEMSSFVDGTSQTAVFSEWVKGDGIPPGASAPGLGQVYFTNFPSTFYLGQLLPAAGLRQDYFYAQLCQNIPQLPTTNTWTWKGDWWASGQSATYSHTQLPNRTSCYYNDFGQPQAAAINMLAASSRHPGGVNVAFADGSVRFVKSSVSPTSWYAIATPAGNEVISSDSF
jgi:prepilin-type processing-associated H-X9-DG protein